MNSRIKELFEQYETGQASAAERKLVEDWFAGFNNDQSAGKTDASQAAMYNEMDKKIDHLIFVPRRKHPPVTRWLQIAAVLLLAAGLYWVRRYQPAKPIAAVTFTNIIVPRGVKKQFLLPDGTFVHLNSGSVLSIPSNFNQKDREVTLTGEGFFEVKHDAAKPFAIHSEKLLITDLGTAFDVKAYPKDKLVKVAVQSGSVKVEQNIPGKTPQTFASAITRNQQLTNDELSGSHTLSAVQTSNLSAWQRNQLRFDNASVEDIATVLERWYNVSVKFTNYHKCRRYTVSFNNEPVSKVLRVLSGLTGMGYQINNQTITINLKNCGS